MIQRSGPAQELRATIDRLPLDVRHAVLDGIKSQRIIAGAHVDAGGGVCPMVAAEVSVSWTDVNQSSVKVAQQAARAWDRYAEASGSSRTATKRQLLALTSMLEASILEDETGTELPLCDAITEFERARSRGSSDVPMAAPAFPATPVGRTPVGRTRYLGLTDAYEAPAEVPTPPEVPAHSHVIDLPVAAPSVPDIPEAAPSVPEVPEVPDAAPSISQAPAVRRALRPRRETGERDRTDELRDRDGWAWMRPFRTYDEYEETLLRALAEIEGHDERQLEELQVR